MHRLTDALLEKTLLGYTRVGYRMRGLEPFADDGWVRGRNVLVTGATSGLGQATARRLARLGAQLCIVGRSDTKLESTATELRALAPGVRLRTERADLSIMAEVGALAERLLARGEPLHVLVNCAGLLVGRRKLTSEGLERTFATNLLGHYLLTERLHPLLVRGAPSRVINVSSGGMYTERLRPDDLETERMPYAGASVYARTKRGQVVLTEHWAERWEADGIRVHCMHPGWADTEGVRVALPRFHRITKAVLRDADEGADTIVWLAAAEEAGRSTGLFWHDRRTWPTHRFARTHETASDREAFVRALDAYVARLAPPGAEKAA